MNQKRLIKDEKQVIATELATLEMGNYKKSEDINILKGELERQRQELQK